MNPNKLARVLAMLEWVQELANLWVQELANLEWAPELAKLGWVLESATPESVLELASQWARALAMGLGLELGLERGLVPVSAIGRLAHHNRFGCIRQSCHKECHQALEFCHSDNVPDQFESQSKDASNCLLARSILSVPVLARVSD